MKLKDKKYTVLIIIPAYNEEQNIKKVVDEVVSTCPNCDYVVVNDCSADRTEELLQKHHIHYINLPVNLGIGGCVQTGYCYAYERGYDIAVQFDGDGQHDAEYIHRLIAPILNDTADITIGSRFMTKEGFQSSFVRRLVIIFFSTLIRLLSGTKILDVSSGMRASNKKLIKLFARNYPQDYPEAETNLSISLLNYRVQEIPVKMRERQHGSSSITPLKCVYYLVKVTLSLLLTGIKLRMK